MSRDSRVSSDAWAVVRTGMSLYTGSHNLSPSHQPDARAPNAPTGLTSQRPGRQGRRQAKERTHHLDNPEPTSEQTPTSKESPAASASNGPATNGPATNGGNGGTATATATRREAPPALPSRKYYTITELND